LTIETRNEFEASSTMHKFH